MSVPQQIREAFALAVAQLAGVAAAFDHEPEELPDLNAGAVVTMLIRAAPPRVVSTGGVVDVDFTWSVYVYNRAQDFGEAQAALTELLPPLLLITIADPTLGDTCDKAQLLDTGEEPFFEDAGAFAVLTKRLQLVATAELAA